MGEHSKRSSWKQELIFRWSFCNSKVKSLGVEVGTKSVAFGLPAGDTCPMSGFCREICYAEGGRYAFDSVQDGKRHNLQTMKQVDIQSALIHDLIILSDHGYGLVRIHDTGDFYSPHYLGAWIAAAQAQGGMILYAYTKSIPWILKAADDLPTNFRFVQSEGGKLDSKIDYRRPWARVYPTHGSLVAALEKGEVQWNGSETDRYAMEGRVGGIGLYFHGTHGTVDLIKINLMGSAA